MGWKDVARQAEKDSAFASNLKAALGGDPAAKTRVLEWLTRNAQEAITHFVRNKFGYTANTADDIVQQSFISLWNGLRDGRGTSDLPADFLDWVLRLAYKHSLDKKKRVARRAAHETALPHDAEGDVTVEPADPATGVLTRAVKKEKAQRLKAAIFALDGEKQNLALAYLDTPNDWVTIGKKLGKSPNAARVMFNDYVCAALHDLVRTALTDRTAIQARVAKTLTVADLEEGIDAAKMDAQYAEVLRLRLRDGLSNDAIAEKLGMPPATSERIYTIARATVKPHVKGDLPRGRIAP